MRKSIAVFAVLATVACGGDDPTGPGVGGGGASTMSASIDGQSWTPISSQISGTFVSGVFGLAGTDTGQPNRQINITVNNLTGPSTHDLGPANANGFAVVTFSGNGTTSVWTTTLPPATGSVTFTSVSASEISGTFTYTAQSSPGTAATGQVSVTSGKFSLKL
jgi:hypothetical protein